MTSVHDVAAYITGYFPDAISTMKLQRLCYIAQGWSELEPGTITTGVESPRAAVPAEAMVREAAATLRSQLNVCGDDRGCQCELAHEQSESIALQVLAAALSAHAPATTPATHKEPHVSL